MTKRKLLTLMLILILATAGYFLPRSSAEKPPPAAPGAQIYIRVTGAVYHPGIVAIPYKGTVQNAVDAASGALPEADLSRVDLRSELTYAQPLEISRRP